MSDQLKNILIWGLFGLSSVLSFVVVFNAIADEAADAERNTKSPYLVRVIGHIVRKMPSAPTVASAVGMANPASENCVKQGGMISIVDGVKGQYGVCTFKTDYQCEEWALMNGKCPKGGVKTTGLSADAAKYCAITGGTYSMSAAAAGPTPEKGTCVTPGDKKVSCDALAYYERTCPVAE